MNAAPHPTDHPQVHVALVGSPADLPDIATFLPRRWGAVRRPGLTVVTTADVLVVGGATPGLVAAARLMHPTATIVAVIGSWVPTTVLVAVMQAGADACVRIGPPAWLAGQVLAAHRRRQRLSGTRLRLLPGAA